MAEPYTSPPEILDEPTKDTDAVNKAYVDDTAGKPLEEHESGGDTKPEGDETVENFILRGALRTATAIWDPSPIVHGHGYYEVQLDSSSSFDSDNLQTAQVSATLYSFSDLEPGAYYYARCRPVAADGAAGEWETDSTQLAKADGSDIQAGSVTADHGIFAEAAIQDADIANLTADKITAGTIDADVITVDNLDASNITTGVIDADEISIENINASNITTGTITGVTFRTSASGQRVEMSTAERESIRFYDGNGNIIGRIGPIDGTFSDALTLGTDGYLRVRDAGDNSFAHIDCGSLTANGGNLTGEDISGTNGYFTASLEVGGTSVALAGHSHNYASDNHDNDSHAYNYWRTGSSSGLGPESNISTVQYEEQDRSWGNAPGYWAPISHVHASGDFEPASSSLAYKTDLGEPSLDALDLVRSIEPITFRYAEVEGKVLPKDPEGATRLGVDVEQVPWPLRDPARDDCLYGHGFSTLLAMAIQQLTDRVEQIEEAL